MPRPNAIQDRALVASAESRVGRNDGKARRLNWGRRWKLSRRHSPKPTMHGSKLHFNAVSPIATRTNSRLLRCIESGRLRHNDQNTLLASVNSCCQLGLQTKGGASASHSLREPPHRAHSSHGDAHADEAWPFATGPHALAACRSDASRFHALLQSCARCLLTAWTAIVATASQEVTGYVVNLDGPAVHWRAQFR